MDHPLPWLKYIDAAHVQHGKEDFTDMLVESPTGEKLGGVDGFIVDTESARPYYVVVNAGGWFKSKDFLLPVGHAQLSSDTDRDAIVADLSRDRIDRFPGFDKDEFEKLTPDEIKQLNDDTCRACSVTEVSFSADEPYTAAWVRDDYRFPDWWAEDEKEETRESGEASPFFDGRARPGDVIGLETGGESTGVGDTRETENQRRRAAEASAPSVEAKP